MAYVVSGFHLRIIIVGDRGKLSSKKNCLQQIVLFFLWHNTFNYASSEVEPYSNINWTDSITKKNCQMVYDTLIQGETSGGLASYPGLPRQEVKVYVI